MNRTLRRPMFRIGGRAEGITSGLDGANLTASRVGYKRGRVVEPGGYQGDENIVLERTKESFPEYQKALQDVRGERRPYLPQFLMSMGLDLATRPKSGNIFQQVAASAKGPLDKWMEHRASSYGTDDKLASALFGDVMDIETRKELQRKKLESEERQATIKAGEGKEFDIGQAAKIAKLRDDMYQKQLELNTEKSKIEVTPENERTEGQKNRLIQITQAELPSTQGTIADLDGAESTIALINKHGLIDDYRDLIDKYETEEGMTHEEAILAALKFYGGIFSKIGKTKDEERTDEAEGGRIGYQNAGSVMPGALPSAIPVAMPGARPMDQGQDDTVQDLSFEELRARLPQEITSDIVKLLSESKQALVDFANIRTQQDVNAFNQKYDVNLVVPQEV